MIMQEKEKKMDELMHAFYHIVTLTANIVVLIFLVRDFKLMREIIDRNNQREVEIRSLKNIVMELQERKKDGQKDS
jgi:hypothetical protein